MNSSADFIELAHVNGRCYWQRSPFNPFWCCLQQYSDLRPVLAADATLAATEAAVRTAPEDPAAVRTAAEDPAEPDDGN